MIIVSQDRNRIINFNNILQLYISRCQKEEITEYYIRYEDCNNSYEDIGTYKTKKRAKEVLQKIIHKYLSYLELEGRPAILQGQMDIQPNIFNIPKVYYMPKD